MSKRSYRSEENECIGRKCGRKWGYRALRSVTAVLLALCLILPVGLQMNAFADEVPDGVVKVEKEECSEEVIADETADEAEETEETENSRQPAVENAGGNAENDDSNNEATNKLYTETAENNHEEPEHAEEDADPASEENAVTAGNTENEVTQDEKIQQEAELQPEEEEPQGHNPTSRDELSYDAVFFMNHLNRKFVSNENMTLGCFIDPVTVARGLATYNERAQKEFDVTEGNFLAGVNYEMPVYDVDPSGEYYVAKPNVNISNNELKPYDITVVYNNNRAEHIQEYHYEDDILYIPKAAIDDPQNVNELISDTPIAVQLNYSFEGIGSEGDGADFSKSIPVQVLTSRDGEPENRMIDVENLFYNSVTIPDVVGRNAGYTKDDISVYVNGMMIPLGSGSWELEGGNVVIGSPAAIISNVNIIVNSRSKAKEAASVALSFISDEAYAVGIGMDDMQYYKTAAGKKVTLTIEKGDVFVGWRGYVNTSTEWLGTSFAKARERAASLPEVANSANYMYGGYAYSREPEDNDAGWAIQSYSLGANVAVGVSDKLSKDMLVYENNAGSGPKKTIYEWMLLATNELRKNEKPFGNYSPNGLGGINNYLFKWPTGVITGSNESLISSGEHANEKNGNIKIGADQMPEGAWLAMGCTHFDETDATDSDSNNTVYVTCLGLDEAKGYIVLAFVTANKTGGQNGCAVYKFAIETTGRLKVRKTTSAGADYQKEHPVTGAEYTVFNSKGKAVRKLTIGAGGTSETVELDSGKYTVRETYVPKGYKIDPKSYTVDIGAGSDIVVESKEARLRPSISTSARDKETGCKAGHVDSSVTLVDTVSYSELMAGRYNIYSTLMDKSTGEPVMDKHGNPVTGTMELIVSEEMVSADGGADGRIEVEVSTEGSLLEGKAVVFFEELKDEKGGTIAAHTDIDDKEQTIVFPGYEMYKVRVENAMRKYGTDEYGFRKGITVSYDVFISNTGQMDLTMDVSDEFEEHPEYFSKPVVVSVSGAEENSRSEDENTVNITVKAGETAVVRYASTISMSAKEYLAANEVDSDSKDKEGNDCNKDVRTNEPDEKDGYRNIAKTSNVEYSSPDDSEKKFNMEDKNDDAQTPVMEPVIFTTLQDGDGRHAMTTDRVSVTDSIEYHGLTAGKSYIFEGTLMLKSTGEPLVRDGRTVTERSSIIVPESDSGNAEVAFEFDTKDLDGESLVAFEVAYNVEDDYIEDEIKGEENPGTVVARHEDIENAAQTILVYEPTPVTHIITRTGGPNTGDRENIITYAILLTGSTAGIAAAYMMKKKAGRQHKHKEL